MVAGSCSKVAIPVQPPLLRAYARLRGLHKIGSTAGFIRSFLEYNDVGHSKKNDAQVFPNTNLDPLGKTGGHLYFPILDHGSTKF